MLLKLSCFWKWLDLSLINQVGFIACPHSRSEHQQEVCRWGSKKKTPGGRFAAESGAKTLQLTEIVVRQP